jgi:hypothetical protein
LPNGTHLPGTFGPTTAASAAGNNLVGARLHPTRGLRCARSFHWPSTARPRSRINTASRSTTISSSMSRDSTLKTQKGFKSSTRLKTLTSASRQVQPPLIGACSCLVSLTTSRAKHRTWALWNLANPCPITVLGAEQDAVIQSLTSAAAARFSAATNLACCHRGRGTKLSHGLSLSTLNRHRKARLISLFDKRVVSCAYPRSQHIPSIRWSRTSVFLSVITPATNGNARRYAVLKQ